MKGRRGAYFSACDDDGVAISTIGVGPISRAKRKRYKHFSEEKGLRLALLKKYAGHTASRESADDDVEFFTGGITVDHGGYQISGYPADVDECGSVAIAYAMHDLGYEQAVDRLARNPLRKTGLDVLDAIKKAQEDEFQRKGFEF